MADPEPAKRIHKGGRQKGQLGLRTRMTASRMMAHVRAGRMLPLDAMMNALQDAAQLYQHAKAKVLDAKGRMLPDAEQHMADFKEKLQLMMEVAKITSPYVHAKMATVDFQLKDETRQMVIRAPELVESAKEWEDQNRKLGYLVDAPKDKAN
jgi:hypothetical protein